MIMTIPGKAFERLLYTPVMQYHLRRILEHPFRQRPGVPFRSLEDLAPGEGDVVSVNPYLKVAAFRDEKGTLHALNATCTHGRCVVAFNAVEQTWDCPSDGSRFGLDGTVLSGPATQPLETRHIDQVPSTA